MRAAPEGDRWVVGAIERVAACAQLERHRGTVPFLMCGRFNLTKPQEIQARFGFLDWHERRIEPRFNIAPSQEIVTLVRPDEGPAQVQIAKWGLEPFWLKRSATGRPPPINARAESLLSGRMFRDALRCLIPATGFFEWKSGKPMHILLKGGGLFAFAGLWLPARRDGGLPTTCILTTGPNELVEAIHNRMPAIVQVDDEQKWLDPRTELAAAVGLLRPYPAELMQAYPVGPLVNSWENETPEVLLPAAPAPVTLPLFG